LTKWWPLTFLTSRTMTQKKTVFFITFPVCSIVVETTKKCTKINYIISKYLYVYIYICVYVRNVKHIYKNNFTIVNGILFENLMKLFGELQQISFPKSREILVWYVCFQGREINWIAKKCTHFLLNKMSTISKCLQFEKKCCIYRLPASSNQIDPKIDIIELILYNWNRIYSDLNSC
jgi:hypothetical protein